MNWRTLAVCLLDFILTLLFSILVLSWLGIGLNTMTLGGLAVAIGTAIDDAIVYGENTYRRLRENKLNPNPSPALQIIFEGSEEVRESLIERRSSASLSSRLFLLSLVWKDEFLHRWESPI